MKLSDISAIISSMKGLMPESMRSTLAHKFIKVIGNDLTNGKKKDTLQQWVASGGVAKFLSDCNLQSPQTWVKHDIAIDDTELATFINRWMNVDQFRRSSDEEFIPVSEDMHSFRFTMIEELKKIANTKRNKNAYYSTNAEQPESD